MPPTTTLRVRHIEHLPAQRRAFLFELVEEFLRDGAFASLVRDRIPQAAHLALTKTVNAPKPLLNPVGVAGQVVVDHQVCALEVHAFASGVSRYQDQRIRFVDEANLSLAALLATECTMNRDSRLGTSEQALIKFRNLRDSQVTV